MKYILARIAILISSTISRIASTPLAMIPAVMIVGMEELRYMYNEVMPSLWSWSVPVILVVVLNMASEIKVVRYRRAHGSREDATFISFLMRFVNRILSYAGWTAFALTMGYKTGNPAVGKWGMVAAIAVELLSFVGNHLETKGLAVNWEWVWGALKSAFTTRTGIEVGDGQLLTRRGGRGCGSLPDDEDNEKSNT